MGRTSVRILALLLALAGAMSSAFAKSDDVSAAMVASEVVVDNGLADTTFKIEVVNRGASPAANVRVVFADGGEVIVGDVAAEGSASSDSQRRVIDISAMPTRNFPVQVTLKYSQDGADIETPATLILRIS